MQLNGRLSKIKIEINYTKTNKQNDKMPVSQVK